MEYKQAISVADTLGIGEKAHSLLGNASNSLSVLGGHKVLYAINRPKKVSLAEASSCCRKVTVWHWHYAKIASDRPDISEGVQKGEV